MRDISDEAERSSRAQVPAALRVAAAADRLLRRRSSPPDCRRSRRGPRDFYLGLLALLLAVLPLAAAPRTTLPFDLGWRFLKSDAPGAEQSAFDDSRWRAVRLPHDWAIEGPFDRNAREGGAGAFLPTGIGWYRKSFTLPADSAGRRVYIEFDGVMANSEVWINGHSLGKRPNGYVSFRYELTPHLNPPGKANLLAVRADNEKQPASRWYAGAGIYRHVRLLIMDQVHIDPWATFVSTPEVSESVAKVHLETSFGNHGTASRQVTVHIAVNGAPPFDGTPQTVPPLDPKAESKPARIVTDFSIARPRLWSLKSPNLYEARIELRENGKVIDSETGTFGIRDATFEADTGFWLNGKNIKIKGVCLHADGGAVGTAVPLGIWKRRLETLKQLGVNAIRLAHNPVAPEFLDLCDRMGFLVMDEMFDQWTLAKNPYDYHLNFREWSDLDLRDTVRRDRNHPSIIVYSAGNEIRETPQADLAKGILGRLIDAFHSVDPTRPVTQGLFRPNVSHDYENGLADMLDVVGQNYRENEILAAHAQKPTRKILGTENTHVRSAWLALRDNPAYAGQFIWAGIDYLGESRNWPGITDVFGLLDRTGEIKPIGQERRSWWSARPMVHLTRRTQPDALPATDPGYEAYRRTAQVLWDDWTPSNTAPHTEEVEVYSNCQQVELSLNGKSLGTQSLPADASPRTWKVGWEPGSLVGLCADGSARHELRTAGKAVAVRLTVDRPKLKPEWDDVAFVTAELVDANGVLVPSATDSVAFTLTGPAEIVAVDNQDIASHEPFQSNRRHAFQGRCIAIVRATAPGKIAITASAAVLKPATARLEAAR